jgi:hypothetical protein
VVHRPPATREAHEPPPKADDTPSPSPEPTHSRLTTPARLDPIRRHDTGRMPLTTRLLLLVAPAVLAAAALRARGGGSGNSSGGGAGSGSGSASSAS